VVDGPDAGRDDDEPAVHLFAQPRNFKTGGDDAIASRLESPPGPRQHQVLDIALEAEVIEIAAVEAGQDGYGQHLEVASLVLCRGFHDRLVSVHGDEACTPVLQLPHRGSNGRGNIEELEIRKDFLVPLQHPVNEVEIPAAHHQLEAKLVEAHRVAKLFRDPPRVIAIRHIHGEYQAFARSRSLVGHLMGLLRWYVTRQSREGAGASIPTSGTSAGRNSLTG